MIYAVQSIVFGCEYASRVILLQTSIERMNLLVVVRMSSQTGCEEYVRQNSQMFMFLTPLILLRKPSSKFEQYLMLWLSNLRIEIGKKGRNSYTDSEVSESMVNKTELHSDP